MAELKREYVVPLRRKTKTAPNWRRSKKAVTVLREFISKHMKSDDIIICNELNEKIWERGIKHPPGKVSVVALRTQIAGVEKTLVNLVEFGVDKYVKAYSDAAAQTVMTPEEELKEEVQSETKAKKVVEAEVKEVEKDADEKKEEKKKSSKKEVAKNE